jgi:hypothetical protein
MEQITIKYLANGLIFNFNIPGAIKISTLEVYINDVLINETEYSISLYEVIFNSAPSGEIKLIGDYKYSLDETQNVNIISDVNLNEPIDINILSMPEDNDNDNMLKSVYDTNGNGLVDDSEKLNNQDATFYLSRDNHNGTQNISTINNLQNELDSKQETLINQTNIKSINGETILGNGNIDIDIESGSGGNASSLYFSNDISTINGSYKTLSYIPDVLETILNITVNNNELLLDTFLFELPIDTNIIDAGNYTSSFYSSVDNNNGETKIRYEVFMRNNLGVETILFSSTSQELTTTLEYVEFETTQPSHIVDENSRYGIKLYVNTTSNSNKNVNIHIGDGNASYTTTPLSLRHNQLRDREREDSHPIIAITGLETRLNNLEINGVVNATIDTNVNTDNYVYFVDSTNNNITLTLPTSVGKNGITINFKKINKINKVYVTTINVETIDGDSSILINYLENIKLISNGINWYII